MRKIILLLIAILSISFLNSCKGNKNSTNQEQGIDMASNEKVQDTFYGVKLGEPIRNLYSALYSYGFFIDTSKSKNGPLYYFSTNKKPFEFGGINWSYVILEKGGYFNGITFLILFSNIESASNYYNDIAEYISKKYTLTDNYNTDNLTYGEKIINGKNGVNCRLTCFEFQDVNKQTFFAVTLIYESNKKSSYDEL